MPAPHGYAGRPAILTAWCSATSAWRSTAVIPIDGTAIRINGPTNSHGATPVESVTALLTRLFSRPLDEPCSMTTVSIEQVDIVLPAPDAGAGERVKVLTRSPIAALAFAATPPAASQPGAEQLRELRKLSERATPGPWAWEQCGDKEDVPVVGTIVGPDDQPCEGLFYEPIDAAEHDYVRNSIFRDCQSNDGHSASANAAFAVAAVNYVRAMLAANLAAIADASEAS